MRWKMRLRFGVVALCEGAVRVVLAGLMVVLVIAMARALAVLAVPLLSAAAPRLDRQIVGALTLLSLLEVYRTVQTYFGAGRVKVTLVLEATLVGLLTELAAAWQRGSRPVDLLLMALAVVTLLGARVLAIRFSPDAGKGRLRGWLAPLLLRPRRRHLRRTTGESYRDVTRS